MRIESRDVIAQPIQHEPDMIECLALLIERIWNFIFCCCPCTFGTDLQNYHIELVENANQRIADLERSVEVRRMEVQNRGAICDKEVEISQEEGALSSATNQAIIRYMREGKTLSQESVEASVYLGDGIWSFDAKLPMALLFKILHIEHSSDQTLEEFLADNPHHSLTDDYIICEKSLDAEGRIVGIKVQGVKEAEIMSRKKAELDALRSCLNTSIQ